MTTSTFVDLARGHVLAVKNNAAQKGAKVFNLGTGIGYRCIRFSESIYLRKRSGYPYKIAPRRAGDIATCYADATKAKEVLGWVAEKNLNDMVRDSWNWQKEKIQKVTRKKLYTNQ